MNNIPLFPVQLVWKYSCPACMEIFLSSLYGNIPVQLVWKYLVEMAHKGPGHTD